MNTPLWKSRKALGLKIEEVADATGLSVSTISRAENGKTIKLPHAAKLAEYYGQPLNELHILYPERYEDFDPTPKSDDGQRD